MANETFTANQTTDATLGFDADGDGVIDPLEVVTSTVTITNNSTTPTPVAATGVQFSETLDGMTIVDQDGDDINVSPIAFDDAYNVIGNITFAVTAADGILGGPTAIHSTLSADAEFFTNTIGANTATQTHIVTTGVIETAGGSVTLNADGSFTYTADAGFTGADSFTYTLTDAGLDGDFATPGDNLTSTATVSLNVGPPVSVWFIDDTAPGSANLGTQADPFTSIADFNAAQGTTGGPAAGDIIYLREGTYEEDDGINLADGQTLIGQGQDLVVNGVTIEEGDPSLTPTIKVNGGANDGIDLGQNNTISGLNVDTMSGSGIGIDDDGHNVGTLSMSDISVSTSTGTGILIDQGGTVTVTGDGNTISSGTGTALNITNTTIGAADVTFQSISSIGGSATGIILDTTGSTGGLHVTGTGTAGSGGTIANKTGADGATTTGVGIYLNNTAEAEFAWMQLNDFKNFAIQASDLNGFSLQNSVISGNNGDNAALDEGAIFIANSSGALTLANNNISGGFEDNLRVLYDSATADTATYNITGNTFHDLQPNQLFNVSLVNLRSTTSASTSSNVTFNFGSTSDAALGNTFDNSANQNPLPPPDTQWFGDGILVTFEGGFQHNINIDNNTFNELSQAINFAANFSADVNARIYNSTITYTEDVGAIVFGTGSSSTSSMLFQMLIEDNDIGGLGNDSGSRQGAGIIGDFRGAETAQVTIHQNVIEDTEVNGILVISQSTTDGDVNLRITNNTVDSIDDDLGVGSGVIPGINVTTNAATNGDIFLTISNNISTGINEDDILVRQATVNNTYSLEDFAGNGTIAADVEAYLEGQNPGTTARVRTGGSVVNYTTMNQNNTNTPAPVTPLVASDGGVEAAGGGTPSGVITDDVLDTLADAAVARWAAAGLSAEQVDALDALTFGVADMSGLNLASFSPMQITLDADAAGRGWYLDGTPLDDGEFSTVLAPTQLQTDATGAPAGHYDLLTALMHEMGHALGLGDSYAATDRDDLMYGWLYTGERRLPGDGDADGAVAGSITEEEFLGAPIDIGVLPAGKTVTIQWQATIDAQTNQLIVNPVNTGAVTATNTDGFPDTDTNTVTTTLDTLILGGTIWNDNGAGGGIGGNGIKDGAEPGIDGVALSAFADDGDGTFDAGDTLLATTMTAGGGLYSFTGLAPGNYIVRVDQSNFNAGGALANMVSAIGTVDPDNNVDNDDNGDPVAGNGLVSLPITLAYNTEPAPGVGNDTNTTLDFGVRADDQGVPLVFKLIDADNGQVIDQDVSDGVAPLDPSVFAGLLTLAGFAASGQTVSGPVTITLTGNGLNFSKVENTGPYSLFGDSGGTTFGGASIQPGAYTVGANANGIPQSLAFTLQAIADVPGPLVFKLIDADNGQVIDQDVSDGVAPLDPSVFAGLLTLAGFAASGQTVSGPVTITLTGNGVNFSKVENVGPYSLFGDSGGTTFGGSSIQPGTYAVGANANGIPQSVPFTLQAIADDPGPLVFKLIDADNGQVIDQDVSDGVAPLDPSVFAGQLTLVGFAASGQTVSGPVTITLTGNGVNFSKVENTGPYSLFGDSGGTTFGGASIQPGAYTVGANANGIPQSAAFTLQAIADVPGPLIKAINAGGGAVTVGGISYEADTTAAPNSLAPGSDNFTFNNAIAIAGTDNDVLHQTERWGDPFGYDIPLANGQYQLELDFAEIYWGAPGGAPGGSGSRVFDVTVEGQQVISNLDLFDDLGAANATSFVIPVAVSDGVLDIDFAADADNAKLSALVVYSDFV